MASKKPKGFVTNQGFMTKQGFMTGPICFDPNDPFMPSYREMERFHAYEMGHVETDRVTHQEPFDGRPDPHSVLVQEARGTREMETSDQLPKDMNQDDLKKMGVEILGPSKGDEKLFIDVKLPHGWTKVRSNDDSRTTYLVDPLGNKRAYMWYKAASYDRAAYGGIRRRFSIVHRNFNDYKVGVAWVVDEREPSKQVPIFQAPDRKYKTTKDGLNDEARQALVAECEVWLDKNYPDWKDCMAYWDNIPMPQPVGEIPPYSQRTR